MIFFVLKKEGKKTNKEGLREDLDFVFEFDEGLLEGAGEEPASETVTNAGDAVKGTDVCVLLADVHALLHCLMDRLQFFICWTLQTFIPQKKNNRPFCQIKQEKK